MTMSLTTPRGASDRCCRGRRRRIPPTSTGDEPCSSKFGALESRAASPARLSRLDSEAQSQSVYVKSKSDAYWDLRGVVVRLEEDLSAADGLTLMHPSRG